MSKTSVLRLSTDSIEDPNIKKGDGEFRFLNGDAYTGGYTIVKDKRFLSRQGQGIYVTRDFNKYETIWVDDQIVGEVNIRHNNGTQYKGTLGIDGGMSGFGTYTFTDNSVLQATWEQNKPMDKIILKEPLGSVWKGVYDGKEIAFTTGNHFWDDINPSIDDGEKEEDADKRSDIDSNNF